jgi:hypothetical protein
MTWGVRHYRIASAVSAAALAGGGATPATAQSVEELQRQIDELKTMVRQLQQEAQQRTTAAPPPATPAAQVAEMPPPRPMLTGPAQVAVAPPQRRAWYDRLRLRGYTQLRLNETISGGDLDSPSGSRLRSVHDGGVTEAGNFTFRRLRIVLEGRVSDDVSIYIQPDFATASAASRSGSRGRVSARFVTPMPTGFRTRTITSACGSASPRCRSDGRICNPRRTG